MCCLSYFFHVHVCVLQLTPDHGCDLILADSDAVLDLTDKSGVDGIIHLQYLQLVVFNLDRVWHLSSHTAETWAHQHKKRKGRRPKQAKKIRVGLWLAWLWAQCEHYNRCTFTEMCCIVQGHQIPLILIGSVKPISFPLPQKEIHYHTVGNTMGTGQESEQLDPKSHLFHF